MKNTDVFSFVNYTNSVNLGTILNYFVVDIIFNNILNMIPEDESKNVISEKFQTKFLRLYKINNIYI